MTKLIVLAIVMMISGVLKAGNIEDVWKNMSKQNLSETRQELERLYGNPKDKVDAQLTNLLINSLEGGTGNMNSFKILFPDIEQPSPYLFSLWFESAVTGGYGKFSPERLAFLQSIYNNPKVDGSTKSSLDYTLAMHYVSSNNFTSAHNYWNKVKAVHNWQYVGTFDNTMGSGFDKSYGPLHHPGQSASFKSAKNADISWFVPQAIQADPWISPKEHFNEGQGIIYFQSFIHSPKDQEVILALGGGGSMKIWVNDVLAMEEESERATGMDFYKRKVKLKSGYNRVLVQLGYTYDMDYPNFIVRFIDHNGNVLPGINNTSNYQRYTKGSESDLGEFIPHFMEAYFKNKIKSQPDNGLNYILLAKGYMRNSMIDEAMEVIQNALKRFPNNPIIQAESISILAKRNDRTEMLATIEKIRSNFPDIFFLNIYDFKINLANEDYHKAEENLEDIIKVKGPDHKIVLDYSIDLSSAKSDYNTMLDLIDKAYQLYPNSSKFVNYKFNLEKSRGASPKKNLSILNNYTKDHYSSFINSVIENEYRETKNFKKLEKLLLSKHKTFPENYNSTNDLAIYYYERGEYGKALTYIDKAIASTPYYSQLWYNRAYIHIGLRQYEQAKSDFQKSIEYNPNQFEAREILRELDEKKPLSSLIYEDREEEIKELQANTELTDEYNYAYLHHEVNYVVYPEGSSIGFEEYAIQMLNETGAEYWQETSVPVNPYSQRLIITKADVLKRNGEKIAAERNYNELVFPTLEVGDVIHISYRLENYSSGKLSKEFWGDHIFNDFVPVHKSIFRVHVPKDYDLEYTQRNLESKPVIDEKDEFKVYEWVLESPEPCELEDHMPNMYESGISVQLSSLITWKQIASWYHDLAIPQTKEDYTVDEVYKELFEGKQNLSKKEKAEIIYDYICNNVSYSSVSFRQGSYVPQKPRKTISTQLGDCKDMSALYHSLANKAGLNTNLVLISTRDNGENSLVLPSTNFNHCIVKIDLGEEGELFQELTDNTLPFGAMPNSLMNAQALVIPNTVDEQNEGELINVPMNRLFEDAYVQNSHVSIDGSNIHVATSMEAHGAKASAWRRYFEGVSSNDLKEAVINVYKSDFDTDIELDTFKLKNEDNLQPMFILSGDFVAEGEVKSIGGLQALKPPLFGAVLDVSDFQKEERKHTFNFWSYHSTDAYNTTTTIELPKEAEIMDLPKNFVIKNDFVDYSLTFKLLPNNVVEVNRKVKAKRTAIEAKDYMDLRDTVKKISVAEDVYIAFK